ARGKIWWRKGRPKSSVLGLAGKWGNFVCLHCFRRGNERLHKRHSAIVLVCGWRKCICRRCVGWLGNCEYSCGKPWHRRLVTVPGACRGGDGGTRCVERGDHVQHSGASLLPNIWSERISDTKFACSHSRNNSGRDDAVSLRGRARACIRSTLQ